MRLYRLAFLPLLAAPVLMTACHRGNDKKIDQLDNELVADGNQDAAMRGSLRNQIMVDPDLAQQSNGDALRPPPKPGDGETPGPNVHGTSDAGNAPAAPAASGKCPECTRRKGALTLGEMASRQANGQACAANVHYSNAWAAKLPADLPVYPGANVSEAAGNDAGGCALRIVSFRTDAKVDQVVNWYYARARKAGYDASHESDGREHVVGGTRGNDAFVIWIDPADGGATADLVVNQPG